MHKRGWLTLLTTLPMTMLLAGCNPGASSVVVCPTIRSYDQATLNRALAEYRALPQGSAIKTMIGDYQVLRDRVHACRKP